MKIKSFSLVIALALCLTISGVYATWTYAEADVASADDTASLTIDAAAIGDAAGVLDVQSTLAMQIVDTDGDHTTALSITGDVVITFTPNPATAASEVPTEFTWTLSGPAGAKFGTENVFTNVNTDAHDITLNADNTYTVTITAAEFANYITLNAIVLETAAEHAEYKAVIDALSTFTITVAVK